MLLVLAHCLWVRRAIGLLEWIKGGDGLSGKDAEEMQECVKMDNTRAMLTDLPAELAFLMAAAAN